MDEGDADLLDPIIERAHLAMIRHQPDTARTLLQDALRIDPQHPEALRMWQQLAPQPSPGYPAQQPVYPANGDGNSIDTDEADHLYASTIANLAGREEAMRLGMVPPLPTSSFTAPTTKGTMLLRLALFLVGGIAIMFIPLRSRHHYYTSYHPAQSFAVLFHLNGFEAVGIGLLFGFLGFLSAPTHRQYWP